ncbi:MAG TPA: PKD domain-containing protein [Ramlibacter sp.]|nr:PKD domain-containing protein [Ramlibacter sp.]
MRQSLQVLLAATAAALLVSCGGGGDEAAVPAFMGKPVAPGVNTSILAPQAAIRQPLAQAAAPTPDQVMDWGEQNFPQFFPPHQVSSFFSPYLYRYYAQTNIYLAVDGELVQVYGPDTFGPNIITVGTLADFTCLVFPQSCQPSTPGLPTANAGAGRVVYAPVTVTLQGSGSDPHGAPLTYSWSFQSKPAGSNAVLANANTANPSFVADMEGEFVVRLVVNNGSVNSEPSTVTITALPEYYDPYY